jgi:phosphatidylglycerophosphate synthase
MEQGIFMPLNDRRPLKSRSTAWAKALAARALKIGLSPNHISVASIGAALLGAVFLLDGQYMAFSLVVAALFIQLRLLCNLLDGMVAIEGAQHSPTGAFFNEAPDRVSDVALLVALGYALGHDWVGWALAVLAMGTAYLRALSASFGLPQDFQGPMAKPQRMAVLTVACLLGALEKGLFGTAWCLCVAAAVIGLGTIWTCVARSRTLMAGLERSP